MSKTLRTHAFVFGLAALFATLGPGNAMAQERHAAAHFGLGVATAACNLLYGPAKVIYAVGGSITGGLAWAITGGRRDVARAIMQPALRGDYSLVMENLTMEEPFSFVGRDPEYESLSR